MDEWRDEWMMDEGMDKWIDGQSSHALSSSLADEWIKESMGLLRRKE